MMVVMVDGQDVAAHAHSDWSFVVQIKSTYSRVVVERPGPAFVNTNYIIPSPKVGLGFDFRIIVAHSAVYQILAGMNFGNFP